MRKISLLLLCLITAFSAFAKQITEAEALTIAQKFMQGKRFGQGRHLAKGKSQGQAQLKNLYVFNVDKNGGFVIVSGDDRTQSILGYAEKGSLDESTLPSNVKWLLDCYNHAIATLDDDSTANNLQAKAKTRTVRTSIPALIDTQWGQDEPYNTLCPKIGNDRCVTGCVATAMAQVINYHRWPQGQTAEIPSYTTDKKHILMPSLPSKQFDWNNMSNTAIAQLMLYCGQSVSMNYDVWESGASVFDIPKALTEVFGYSPKANVASRYIYNDEQWDELVYDELSNGRPILYFGRSTTTSHAFIVDGYSNDMYHLNWGWNGRCDGFFTLNNLNPHTSDHYNYSQQMIVNVCPPADVSDSKRPKAIVTSMTCSEYNLERSNIGVDFPTFSVSSTVTSDLANKATLQIGLALYNDEGFVKILSARSHEFNPTDGYTAEYQTTIGADVPQGSYRIVAVNRVNDTDEWLTDFGSTTRYVDVTIEETKLKLKAMPYYIDNPHMVDFGVHTIDGITYQLYSEWDNLRADVLLLNEKEKYSGNIYIPDYVIFQNMTFNVWFIGGKVFDESPELKSLSTNSGSGRIAYCSYLTNLEIRENITNRNGNCLQIENCPALESITYPQCGPNSRIYAPKYCENMKSIIFTQKLPFKIYTEELNIWEKESMPALTDVFFMCNVPPVIAEFQGNKVVELLPTTQNDNVTIHIPKGTLDIYKRSVWKDWNLVEDQETNPVYVNLDYCGNDECNSWDYSIGGITVAYGNDCVEFAMRIPEQMIKAYKGCNISKISFYTNDIVSNDDHKEDVEYVFLTTRNKDYIAKKTVSTIRGTWMTVELDQPYTITGEEIFVGIGKANALRSWWANNDIVEDGLWLRVMGNDYGGYTPGEWYKNADRSNWNHPLPIRAVIEGDKLPTDIIITNAESTGANNQISLALKSRTPKLVKKVTFDWDIDGKRQGEQTVETAMLANHDDIVYIDLPTDLSGRHHTVTINVASIDGVADELPDNSRHVIAFTSSSSKFFPRKIVMEEATDTQGGWCPKGIVTIDKMTESYPDNFIAISIHDDEAMRPINDSYNDFLDIVNQYPNAYINRNYWIDPSLFNINDIKDKGEALITAKAYLTDENKVRVETETEFGFNDDGSTEYRIAYVLTENNVGPYQQANYYSNPDAEHNPDDLMDWWVHQSSSVETKYNNVARIICDDYSGVKELLPNEIKEGQKYNSKYEFTLPDNIQDKANLNVVTLLIDGTTGEILNADRTPIKDPSGIHSVDTDKKLFDVYNIMGMKVRSKVSSLKGLPAGIYIVNGTKNVHKP